VHWTLGEGYASGNDNLDAATNVLIRAELCIDLAIERHVCFSPPRVSVVIINRLGFLPSIHWHLPCQTSENPGCQKSYYVGERTLMGIAAICLYKWQTLARAKTVTREKRVEALDLSPAPHILKGTLRHPLAYYESAFV
jgi:hypothetical protein